MDSFNLLAGLCSILSFAMVVYDRAKSLLTRKSPRKDKERKG